MSAPAAPPERKQTRSSRGWRWLTGAVADHPLAVSGVLGLLVVGHAVLSSWTWPWLNPYKALAEPANLSTAVTIYLFTAAAAALVASLAGVIIVFVVSAQTPQVRQFREQAGIPLRRTWVTVVAEPFVAALLGVVAAITQTTVGHIVGPWLFEGGLILLAHSAIRLVLLLRELVDIVASDDEKARQDDFVLRKEDVFGSSE